jgi:hypothetical protein
MSLEQITEIYDSKIITYEANPIFFETFVPKLVEVGNEQTSWVTVEKDDVTKLVDVYIYFYQAKNLSLYYHAKNLKLPSKGVLKEAAPIIRMPRMLRDAVREYCRPMRHGATYYIPELKSTASTKFADVSKIFQFNMDTVNKLDVIYQRCAIDAVPIVDEAISYAQLSIYIPGNYNLTQESKLSNTVKSAENKQRDEVSEQSQKEENNGNDEETDDQNGYLWSANQNLPEWRQKAHYLLKHFSVKHLTVTLKDREVSGFRGFWLYPVAYVTYQFRLNQRFPSQENRSKTPPDSGENRKKKRIKNN